MTFPLQTNTKEEGIGLHLNQRNPTKELRKLKNEEGRREGSRLIVEEKKLAERRKMYQMNGV